jgi:tRNA-2-methylthio-N6-dimethylallyladenosine synthase
MSFVELLRKVAAVPGVERIRFTSPHPQEVRDDFIEFVTSEPKVARHIHMPLQSGSDRILRLMSRNYRRSRYMQIIESLKQRVPDIGITTDLIVGFPSETEADFEDTLSAMREVDFDASFSFAFSPRPGTEAAALKEELTHAQKIERLMRLQALQDEITTRRLMAWVGRETEILVDGETQRDSRCVQGRLSQNIVVNLECPIPEVRLGDLVKVRIKAANRFTLLAEPVPAPDVDADVKTVVSCNY